ncbi:phage tail protein [Pantoea sp.]|uniref:phage tail protein n=1 Tax=Pantoea sp. TaxID=69393 RepID=UPI0031CEF85B
MTTKYFALLTNQGAALLANAAALGTQVNISTMAVGDGGGMLPTPDPTQTKLIGEKRRAPLNALSVDAANSSQIIAEQIIPEGEGGFWIREIGLYDANGVLIAVANCAETYKPQLAEGSGRTQTVRMILIVNSTSAVTLKIDPSVVLATRQYVDDRVIEVRQYADALMAQAKKYTDDQLALHVKADNPHAQYLAIAQGLSEIKSAGKVAQALKNLGIGRGVPLIGSPFAWPHAKLPNEVFPDMAGMVFLRYNGTTFDANLYPDLALIHPDLKLPDMRGEFMRGADEGRLVDPGRTLLSAQGHALQQHSHYMYTQGAMAGTVWAPLDNTSNSQTNGDSAIGNGTTAGQWTSQASGPIGSFATETRPRNLAFNFVVRAS